MSDAAGGFQLSQRARRTSELPISYLMAQGVNPHIISLAAGLVDYDSLPCEQTGRLAAEVLEPEAGPRTLQYGTTPGDAELRKLLLRHLAQLDDVPTDHYNAGIDDIIVTTGSQQMLYLLTDVLVDPGDIVITAWPSYFVYTGLLETFGATVRTVDMDEQGMIPHALDALLREIEQAGELDRVKILYVQDYHQNPTGITLAESRRPELLDIVRRYSGRLPSGRILLLEDAAYRELTYEGSPPPSIKRWDTDNRFVALLQTFSKPFAPGLKTGYALLPTDLIEPITLQKGSHDFGSPNLCQRLLAAAMRSDIYTQHVHRARQAYVAKRDAMLLALDEHLASFEPEHTHWTHPRGGLYVWLTLPHEINTGRRGELFRRALEEGVIYVPGEFCFGPDPARQPPHNTMRLSYGVPKIEQIHEGIVRLARAIRSMRT